MRGYFAVGVDGISKPMNLGNLMRIAHAFGASFFFTIDARVKLADAQSDTSDASGHLPLYQYALGRGFAPAAGLPAGRRGDHRRRNGTAPLQAPAARGLCVRRRAHVAFAALYFRAASSW